MPIRAAGAGVLSPRGSGSTITTVAAFLTSISKDSWYSLFEAGTGMFQNSNGTGSVATGDPVGCWAASVQVGATFKFVQATSASRPTYSTTQYRLPTIYGNGTSHNLACDSTTALNRTCSVVVQYITGATNTGMVWSQNGQTWGIRHTGSTSRPLLLENGSDVNSQGVSAGSADELCANVQRYRASATAWAGDYLIGLSSTDEIRTSRHGAAITLLTGAGLFSTVGIRRILVSQRLTFDEMTQVGKFMVS